MRILHLSHYYPPETHGGTQGYVEELAGLQRMGGHEVSVLAGARSHAETGGLERCEQNGVQVIRIGRNLQTEGFSGDLGSDRIGAVVNEVARELAPDVAHVHHWHALTRDVVRRLGEHRIPVVLTLHDLYTTCPRFFRMPDARSFCDRNVTLADCAVCVAPDVGLPADRLQGVLAERATELGAELAAADTVLAVSAEQRDFLRSLPGFPDGEIRVLGIGTVSDHVPPAPPAPQPGRLRVVNWAGLDPRKGIHVLLQAVARCRHRAQIEVHLHGSDAAPEYTSELRGISGDLDVTFHGRFADADRFQFAGRYDVAVFPFLAYETYALVVDEALRSGIPVLVSDHGAPPGRIGSCGAAFPNADVDALARLLDRLVDAPDELRAMRSGTHGARDLRQHYAELMEVYERVYRGPPSGQTPP